MYSVPHEVSAAVKAPLQPTSDCPLTGSRLSSVAISETPPLFDFHVEVLKGDLEWVIPPWKARDHLCNCDIVSREEHKEA